MNTWNLHRKTLGSHFKNRIKKKIDEALLIEQERLSLNVQDQSVELTFSN